MTDVTDLGLSFEDEATFVPDALQIRDVVLDPIFGRRRDALLRTVPVHQLVDRAERADSGITGFDVRALVLAAFDAVIARQGFSERTTPDQVLALLVGIASTQNPAAGPGPCRTVAEHVVDGLTNRREREQFKLDSIVYAEGERGEIMTTSVPRRFWLLREQEDATTGGTYLEASADAVNALVSGLDMPIEDQQAALETVLERQLARGDLDAAHVTAMQARRLTAAYIAQTDELLAETERYLPGTDWQHAAPLLLNRAVDHISECLTRESRLLQHVAGGRESGPSTDPDSHRRAKISAKLTRLLTESRHLHTALMERLIGARGRFLDAQNAQMFRPVISSVEFDLADDLLVPTLSLRTAQAEAVAEAYLTAALGPVPPLVLNWGELVATLIGPAAPPPQQEPEPETEIEFRPDPSPLVSRELLASTHAVLDRVLLPARLSSLLAACPDAEGDSAAAYDLFSAAALRGYDNAAVDSAAFAGPDAWEEDDKAGAVPSTHGPVNLLEVLGPDAACHSDGTLLDGPGWDGDDLIVCADRDQLDAILLGQEPVPDPIALPARTPRGERCP